MKRITPKTPPGFAKVRGLNGRIFYKILYPIYPWLYTLHKNYKESLEKLHFQNACLCVKPHLKQRFLLKVDIKNAFDSVTEIIANRFADVYFENQEYFFHENGGLIQGAPSSPVIFHLYCREMLDPNLTFFCKQNRLLITRYVDDILISSHNPISKEVRFSISEIIKQANFVLNRNKTLYVDNKFQSLVFVGIRIFNHEVRPEDSFLKKLQKTSKKDTSYRGLKNWETQILALNK